MATMQTTITATHKAISATHKAISATHKAMSASWDVMATCPKGMESALAKELVVLGAEQVTESVAAVYFTCEPKRCYYIINWTRIANRLVLVLARDRCDSLEAFDELVGSCDWPAYFAINQPMLIDFNGSNNEFRNTRYGAQRTKDGIQASFQRQQIFDRLEVDLDEPQIRVHVRAFKNRYTVGLDLVGESLHRRGYRAITGAAPLKENLAAAILRQLGWAGPGLEKAGKENPYEALFDPLCGSATLLIEAALIHLDIAPSYLRDEEGFLIKQLKVYEPALWSEIRDSIRHDVELLENGELDCSVSIFGSDVDPRSIGAARENIAAAKLERYIKVRQTALGDIKLDEQFGLDTSVKKGLAVSNPPYGHRLGEQEQLVELYADIGSLWSAQCSGWDAALFTGNHELGFKTGYRSWRQHKMFNGDIECQLQRYRIEDSQKLKVRTEEDEKKIISKEDLSESAMMLYNRLAKFSKRFKRELSELEGAPYRIYDADLSEFNCLIDVYPAEDTVYLQLQEYAPPKSVDVNKAQQRVREASKAALAYFEVPRAQLAVKQRSKQSGKQQYQKKVNAGQIWKDPNAGRIQIHELTNLLWVDPGVYLDTGLFVDSRGVRRWIAEHAKDKNILNLFCYTATASVAAAKGGAKSTVSIDMSATYLDWAKQNFIANDLDLRRHQLQQADCLQWLEKDSRKFDLILLDPPSFSNSKRMESVLDIQKDHASLIDSCMSRLTDKGLLLFCTNKRHFKLDRDMDNSYQVLELTAKTLDFDCQQSRQAHRSWLIQKK